MPTQAASFDEAIRVRRRVTTNKGQSDYRGIKRMNLRLISVIAIACLFFITPRLSAQTVESQLVALERLPPQERQQKLLDGAKSEGEALVYANMDVAAMKPLTDGFMKRYPGVKVASVHFSG